MYPRSYFDLFPPFPRKPQAFVAMSFDERFRDRWETLFEPALGLLQHNGIPVRPFRVDLSKTSDAILTEILGAIADSLVIVGEITALDELNKRPIRNANVMYEIGIAHATRLPEEIVLFRSDDQYLDFDIAGVRVHHYDPGADPTQTRQFIADTVVASLAALQSRQRTTIRAAFESLTWPACLALILICQKGELRHPPTRSIAQAVGAIEHTQGISLLLSIGAVRADMSKLTPEMLKTLMSNPSADASLMVYKVTPLGTALFHHIGTELGMRDPAIRSKLESFFEETPSEGPAQSKA